MVTKKSTPNRHTKPHGDPYHNERVRMHRTADRAIDTSENAKYDGASGLKEMTKKKKATRFVLRQKIDRCPYCGNKKIEGSWGTAGYMQCNHCGKEWRPY